MALSIKIGGTTYRGTTDYSIKQQGGAVSTTSLNVLLGANPIPLVLQVAQVYLDGTLFFSGLIQSVSTPEYSSTYETKVFSIDVSSLECLMNHRLVTKNFYYYTYTSWTQVIQYLFDNYISQEGITLGSISTTSTTFDSKYAVADKKLYDVLNDIADAIGNASWWISADRKFYFKISTDFTEVVPPTHLTKLKLSEKIGDIRTVEKMTGASSGITATETNATLLATIAARTGGSGKIEIADTDSDIHSDSKAATTANKKLLEYAESEKTITCVCHDLSKSEIYNSWPLNLTINGVTISGDYVVTDRTIEDHGPDAFSISVTLKNNNYFSRYGYSLKRVATATNKVSSSILDICADNKLTASEKPTELSNWNTIAAEKAGYDSEADSHSVSRVAYDAAFQALATYLNGGTTWISGIPLWFAGEHITETTDIDGGDYDDTWQAYYLSRTGLEESIRSAIQSDASAAASAAAAAATLANAASKSWTQSSAPTIGTRPNAINGDTWYDTDDGSKYEAISGAWVLQTSDVPLDPAVYYSMDEVPEVPDDPAGVMYIQDKWESTDGWTIIGGTGLGNISISDGRLIFTKGEAYTHVGKNLSAPVGAHIRIKAHIISGTPSSNILRLSNYPNGDIGGQIGIYDSDVVIDYTIIGQPVTQIGFFVGLWESSNLYSISIDWVYVGTGAYLPGSVLDNSGHGNHGQAFAVTPVAGVSGNGLQGSSIAHITMPITWSNKMTRSFWIKPDAGIINRFIFSSTASWPNNGDAFYANDTTGSSFAYFVGDQAGHSVSGVVHLALGVWHFVRIVYNGFGNTAQVYANEILVSTISLASLTSDPNPTSEYWFYGNGFSSYTGELDEIARYSRVLSAQEGLGLFKSKSLPKVYTRARYLVDSAASDGVITPAEKYNILVLWYQIGKDTASGSFGTARARAISLGVSYSALESAWNALYTYLWTTPGVLIATSWDSNISASKTGLANLQAAYFAAELAQTNLNATTDAQTKANAVPKYLGRFVGAHAPTSNSGDSWLVIDTDDSPIQRGCYYNNAGTPTRISAVSGETGYTTDALLLAKMQATMNDVAWAVANGYGISTNYGISAYFEALAANEILAENIIVKNVDVTDGINRHIQISPIKGLYALDANENIIHDLPTIPMGSSDFYAGHLMFNGNVILGNDNFFRASDIAGTTWYTISLADYITDLNAKAVLLGIETVPFANTQQGEASIYAAFNLTEDRPGYDYLLGKGKISTPGSVAIAITNFTTGVAPILWSGGVPYIRVRVVLYSTIDKVYLKYRGYFV